MSNQVTAYSKASLPCDIYGSDKTNFKRDILAEKLLPNCDAEIFLGILSGCMLTAGIIMMSVSDPLPTDDVFCTGFGLMMGAIVPAGVALAISDAKDADAKKRLTKEQVNQLLNNTKQSFRNTYTYLNENYYPNEEVYRFGYFRTQKEWLTILSTLIADINKVQQDPRIALVAVTPPAAVAVVQPQVVATSAPATAPVTEAPPAAVKPSVAVAVVQPQVVATPAPATTPVVEAPPAAVKPPVAVEKPAAPVSTPTTPTTTPNKGSRTSKQWTPSKPWNFSTRVAKGV